MPIPTRIEVRARSGRALGLLTTDGLLVLQTVALSHGATALAAEVGGRPAIHRGPPGIEETLRPMRTA